MMLFYIYTIYKLCAVIFIENKLTKTTRYVRPGCLVALVLSNLSHNNGNGKWPDIIPHHNVKNTWRSFENLCRRKRVVSV